MRSFSSLLSIPTLAGLTVALSAQGFEPPDALDLDPDPNVVEIQLTAGASTWEYQSGVETDVWAYNGTVPGPTIRAEVGNILRVHFTNDLPEPTTIHWHGVETPADMDGSHISQLTVPPGGTFEYEFPLLRDGLYWYHPHVRTFDQVEKSLYGCLLVRDTAHEESLGLDGIAEHILVFDDVLLDEDGQIVEAFSNDDPLENALYHVNGREGNLMLINGREAGSVSLNLPNGRPQRWRFLNAANTTFARLDLNDDQLGLDIPVWQIGSDGGFLYSPFLRAPATLPPQDHGKVLFSREAVFLMPGERMDVVFTPHASPGTSFKLLWKDWFRGRHSATYGSSGDILLPDDPLDGRYPDVELLEMTLVGPEPPAPYYTPPSNLRAFPVPDPQTARGVLPVTFGHASPDSLGNVTFFAQAKMVPDGNGGMTMVTLPAAKVDSFEAFDVEVGETWIWEISNLTHGDHPFHAHGFPFIPYEIEAVDMLDPSNNELISLGPMLKDTIRVPARRGAKGSSHTIVRAVTVFDDTGREGRVQSHGELPTRAKDGSLTSGGWLFHCHVLEHSAKGMLSFLEVHEPDDHFWLLGKGMDVGGRTAHLTGSGSLTPGDDVVIDMVGAAPDASSILIFGFGLLNLPIIGGTLVPSLDTYVVSVSDSSGELTWNVPYAGLPPGTVVYMQAAYLDPAAPFGVALSSALQINIP